MAGVLPTHIGFCPCGQSATYGVIYTQNQRPRYYFWSCPCNPSQLVESNWQLMRAQALANHKCVPLVQACEQIVYTDIKRLDKK